VWIGFSTLFLLSVTLIKLRRIMWAGYVTDKDKTKIAEAF
jgi:hypothetical protein